MYSGKPLNDKVIDRTDIDQLDIALSAMQPSTGTTRRYLTQTEIDRVALQKWYPEPIKDLLRETNDNG